jgi:DNA (cytosine-5)-methyltransferase 1
LKTKTIRVAELFSGIGAQNKALANISTELKFNYEIKLTCEWDMHAILAYDLIHNKENIYDNRLTREELVDQLLDSGVSWNGKNPVNRDTLNRVDLAILQAVFGSISKNNNCVNIKQMNFKNIPDDLDILTYSFPCQDLSNMGHLHGYFDGISKSKPSRSGLLWEIDRVLKEVKRNKKLLPKVLLMENVTSLLSKRHLPDFEKWQSSLKRLGYNSEHFVLKAKEFGVPQNRERLILLSIHKDYYTEDLFLKIKNSIDSKKTNKLSDLKNYLRIDYNKKKYKIEALDAQPNNTKSRLKIWNENPKIIDEFNNVASFIPTITTKQDRHPNSGNLYYLGNENKAKFRYLTPRECFMLMGFDEDDYESLDKMKLKSFNSSEFLSKDIRYKLAGNSVVVQILEAVFYSIIENVDLSTD